MPTFRITNTYKYTATIEVEAQDVNDALSKSLHLDDEKNNDDWLYESDVKQVKLSKNDYSE